MQGWLAWPSFGLESSAGPDQAIKVKWALGPIKTKITYNKKEIK